MDKEDLIKQVEEGKGLGIRIAKRELDYVKKLWRGEEPTKDIN